MTPYQYKYIYWLVEEPVQYANLVGFHDLRPDLHGHWINELTWSDEDYTLQAHRGSYKTTCVALSIALCLLLKPSQKIAFFRKTDQDVKEVIRTVRNILADQHTRYLVYALYGTYLELTEVSATSISTNLMQGVSGTPQLTGMGTGSSATGKHFDRIYTDDIVNISDRVSRAERERTKVFYQELQNIRNPGGTIINTGTPWHKDDAFTLMPPPHQYDCYSTGLLSQDKLQQLRSSMTDSLFSANYELKHIADNDALFHNPHYTDQVEDIYNGVCHLDASYGGGDYTAFTIMHKHSDGHITAYGKLWGGHVDEHTRELCQIHDHYRAGVLYNERNADKGYLAEELRELGFYVKTYHEHTNKFVKISSYLKSNWDRIEWLTDTDPNYINQILDYTEHAEHDDAPDSASSLLREFDTASHLNHRLTGGL